MNTVAFAPRPIAGVPRIWRAPAPICEPADGCPECGGQFFPHLVDPCGLIELVCLDCTRFRPAPGAPEPSAAAADLPYRVRFLRRSEQLVWRVVRDEGPIWPAAILRLIEGRTGEFASRDTIAHALTRLRRAGLALSTRPNGWVVCEPLNTKGGV